MANPTVAEIQVNANVNLTADHDNDYLLNMIDIVYEHVKAYCLGTLFERETITDERNRSYVRGKTHQLIVRLRKFPLVSVTSLSYKIGSTTTSMAITDADLDLVNSKIYLTWYGPLYKIRQEWTTVTTYVAGYLARPADVDTAIALLVAEWVDADDRAATQEGHVLTGYRIGNYAETYSVDNAKVGNLGLGTTRSIRAEMLLKKYRKPGVA
jgi:hypothetical protein